MPASRTHRNTHTAAIAMVVLGGTVGWLCGNAIAGAAAVIAAQIVAVLSSNRHGIHPIMATSRTVANMKHDRLMTRTRRIASQLRDLRSAASSLPDAVVLMDAHDHVRWFNHAAEELLGLHQPRDRGADIMEKLAGSELHGWLLAGGQEPLDDISAPGSPARHISATLLPFGNGRRVLLVRDISDLTRLEQIRRDFVANVSHELRTPLTVIHGYLELLDPEDVPELAPVLGEMRIQSRRMGQIVEDLLTLSRLETQENINDERVIMDPLLATLRREAEALSQNRHRITLRNDAHRDLSGSNKDLHSAFSNLVSNAVRYTPTGGQIDIRWELNATGAMFSVHDSGFGIPATHLARLTERFYRVSSSRSRDSGGTGLGLSIVKHVLNLHHARLQIESQPGSGSTFACIFNTERLLEPAHGDEALAS
jgi:two-component system phosphate regulon sensor histidine kinase PhoR